MIRSSDDVRAEFKRKGISISEWAIANGYPPNLVYEVLADRRNPTRGKTHRIAVQLGLKDGEIVRENELATAIGA
jgi:gp16 family phage-associated protein